MFWKVHDFCLKTTHAQRRQRRQRTCQPIHCNLSTGRRVTVWAAEHVKLICRWKRKNWNAWMMRMRAMNLHSWVSSVRALSSLEASAWHASIHRSLLSSFVLCRCPSNGMHHCHMRWSTTSGWANHFRTCARGRSGQRYGADNGFFKMHQARIHMYILKHSNARHELMRCA